MLLPLREKKTSTKEEIEKEIKNTSRKGNRRTIQEKII